MDVVDARERQNVGRSFITNTRGVLRTFRLALWLSPHVNTHGRVFEMFYEGGLACAALSFFE